MIIYLIRHWETIEWSNNIILWNLWWKLSEKWVNEAKKIWEFLLWNDYNIKRIITSNLSRSIETWEILSKYIQVDMQQNPLIKERSAWMAEWKSDNEIDWDNYEKKSLPYRKHLNWESFIEVRKRAKEFLSDLSNENQINDSALIVSHSVFILMLLSLINKLSVKDALKIDIKNKIIYYDSLKNELIFIDII